MVLVAASPDDPRIRALDAALRPQGTLLAATPDQPAVVSHAGITIAVIGPDVAAAIATARRLLAGRGPDWIIFAPSRQAEADLRRQLSYSQLPASWSLEPGEDPARVAGAVDAAVRSVRQRRRFRSTLDRINLRLSEREVDTAGYRNLVVSQRYLASILNHATDAIFAVDARATVLAWSKGAQALFGLDADQAIGRSMFDIAEWPRDGLAGPLREALAGRLQRFELEFVHGGGELAVDVTLTPVDDGEDRIIGAAAVVRDISERHRAEQERERVLEAERAARAGIERAARMKDEFLAVLSHELRTPLNAILGYASVLQRDASACAPWQRAADAIARNARAQTRLVDELLDMSAIITGKLRLDVRDVDPAAAVHAAIDSVRAAAAGREIDISLEYPRGHTEVRADPDRLRQIVTNLLTNAVKFSPRGSRIVVTIRREADSVAISVRDRGEGIAPDMLELVFDRFVQADASTRRRHGGLGIGLSIVKQLVDLHGGQVRAESEGPGKGATFTVTLPASQAAANAKQAPVQAGTAPHRLDGLSVLVVDDEADAREVMRLLLASLGARASVAADADEAMDLLQHESFDLVLSDISMPGRNGYEFMEAVRTLADPGKRAIPAVAVTAFSRAEDRARAQAAGYDGHLAKPVDVPALLASIAEAVESRPDRDTAPTGG